jgi:hypothetical protein
MTLSIKVTPKTVYGVTNIYPACEQAKIFCDMVGQKTLTERNLKHIKALGYEIVIAHQEYKLDI